LTIIGQRASILKRANHTISMTELVRLAFGVGFSVITSLVLLLGPAAAKADFTSETGAFYKQQTSSANEISGSRGSYYLVAQMPPMAAPREPLAGAPAPRMPPAAAPPPPPPPPPPPLPPPAAPPP